MITPHREGITMRGKQLALTAAIALAVVVAFHQYQAKKA